MAKQIENAPKGKKIIEQKPEDIKPIKVKTKSTQAKRARVSTKGQRKLKKETLKTKSNTKEITEIKTSANELPKYSDLAIEKLYDDLETYKQIAEEAGKDWVITNCDLFRRHIDELIHNLGSDTVASALQRAEQRFEKISYNLFYDYLDDEFLDALYEILYSSYNFVATEEIQELAKERARLETVIDNSYFTELADEEGLFDFE